MVCVGRGGGGGAMIGEGQFCVVASLLSFVASRHWTQHFYPPSHLTDLHLYNFKVSGNPINKRKYTKLIVTVDFIFKTRVPLVRTSVCTSCFYPCYSAPDKLLPPGLRFRCLDLKGSSPITHTLHPPALSGLHSNVTCQHGDFCDNLRLPGSAHSPVPLSPSFLLLSLSHHLKD